MGVSSESKEDWKQKYLELADELDLSNEAWGNKQKLLCRVIIRLTLATNGLDKSLDPHLITIRDILKKGLVGERLWSELDDLSETLIRAEKGGRETGQNNGLEYLFGFLEFIAQESEDRYKIENLRSRVSLENLPESKQVYTELYDALAGEAEFIDEPTNVTAPGFLGTIFKRTQVKSDAAAVDSELIWKSMIDLLDGINVPLEFTEVFDSLKQKIKSERDPQAFHALIVETVSLLFKAKSVVKDGQHKIEGFLNQLTDSLGELGKQVVAVNETQRVSSSNREVHSDAMKNQFQLLQENSQTATDFDQLQEMISNRLALIKDQLRTQSAAESEQQSDIERRMRELSTQTQSMEQEAVDLRAKLQAAQSEAHKDPLTGLPNRLAYDERLAQEFARWKRFQNSLALLVWDIDYFKSVNDEFGHAVGDKLLKIIAGELLSGIRETDFVCRYGGEEFVMLLPGAESASASKVAEKLRKKIEACRFKFKGTTIPITISCGASQFNEGDQPEKVFDRADKALYRAKDDGRNRCAQG